MDGMDIVISLNEQYLIPAGVMLCSLFENNKTESITVHAMLSGGGSFEQPLQDLAMKYKQKIIFYDMSESSKYHLPDLEIGGNSNYPIESYYRLFVSRILPTYIKKVLYLDCDIIVNENISQLWNEDVSEIPLAAAVDFYNNNIKVVSRLNFDPKFGLFNAGVLIINLDYWRDHHVIDKATEYIKKKYSILRFADNDVLNALFYDKRKEIPLRYNFCTPFLYKRKYKHLDLKYLEEIDEWYRKPSIIHYTLGKPWFKNCYNPMKKYWERYRDMTIWKGYVTFKKESFKDRLFYKLLSLKHGKSSYWKVVYDENYLNYYCNAEMTE